mgnify:CR=1 FL=1
MQFINFLKDIAAPTLASSGLVILILRSLSNKLINQALKKELEEFKVQLQEKTSLLKTSLAIYADEQGIANQRIDQQKAIAIERIYGCICKVSYPVSRIISGSNFVSSYPEDHIGFYRDHAESAHSSSGDLSDLLINYAIYFDEPTYKQIADFSTESSFPIARFLRVIRKNDHSGISPEDLLGLIEVEREKITKIYKGSLKNMQYDLIKKFRASLGFEKMPAT